MQIMQFRSFISETDYSHSTPVTAIDVLFK